MPMLIRARHVVPIDGRPITNGALRIERGRITEVGTAKRAEGTPVVDFGDAVVLPGFVNAHTHLELTHLLDRVPPTPDFVDWIDRLQATRAPAKEAGSVCIESARKGMRLSVAAGVTTVGDITSRPAEVRPALAHGPLRVVSFGEVIATGTIRDQLAGRLQAAIDASDATKYLTVGVSPHAAYTVEHDGIRACVDEAARAEMRLCMHLAESLEELRYLRDGDGPMRAFLDRLGVWDTVIQCPRLAPVPFAHTCGVLNNRTVLAHCNYVSDEDIGLLASTRTQVAYCPRTHAAFEHPPHRFRDMLDASINVCIGTDSLASNPSLSVLDEVRFLHSRYPDFNTHTLLEMITLRGARALGVDHLTGSLTPGKSADITVIPLDNDGPTDPLRNILESVLHPLTTVTRGRRVTS